jgi:UDPglucose--hexose-1-phosphate uridylyltransferase
MTWEQRFHPLRKEWVVIAAHRDQRPWEGESVPPPVGRAPQHVDDCYLCPGNVRVSGARNDPYQGIYVFDNDHPCVGPEAPAPVAPPVFYRNRAARGIARVLCYSPDHSATLAELPVDQVRALLQAWRDQYLELGQRDEVRHVLIFENKGELVGVSNPHPHCQIYATNFVFKTMAIEATAVREHLAEHGRVLFQDIIQAERSDGRRVIAENGGAIAFIPYFARFPYETYVAPKQTFADLSGLRADALDDLAVVLKQTLIRFDNLWRMAFPYVLVLHHAPTDGGQHRGWHFHIQIHPPLRGPNLRKYLAGPEIGGGCFLNDTAPEDTAAQLRRVSATHYLQDESR